MPRCLTAAMVGLGISWIGQSLAEHSFGAAALRNAERKKSMVVPVESMARNG